MSGHECPGQVTGLRDVEGDQLQVLDGMREREPVVWSEDHGWMVLGHPEALEVLEDHETYSNRVSRHLSIPNGMDPPEHNQYRQLIEPFFDHGSMDSFEPLCRAIAEGLVQSLPRDGDIEVVSDVGEQFAVRVQTAFMGWPEHFQGRLRVWARANQEATRSGDRTAAALVADEFTHQVGEELAYRRRLGDDAPEDNTTALARARIGSRQLADEEIVSIVRNWTMGEVATISASVGIVVHFLARRPDIQQQLRSGHDDVSPAIDEILRIDGPLMANRRVATRSTQLAGKPITEGDPLTIFWPSANRDEAVFGDSDHFRPDGNAGHNLIYGAGIHVCPGAPLARLQLVALTAELLKRSNQIEPSPIPSERASFPAAGYAATWVRIH